MWTIPKKCWQAIDEDFETLASYSFVSSSLTFVTSQSCFYFLLLLIASYILLLVAFYCLLAVTS